MPPEEPTSSGKFPGKLSANFAGDPRNLPLQPVCGQQSQPAENNWHWLYNLFIRGGCITTAASLVIKILNIPPEAPTPSGEFLT